MNEGTAALTQVKIQHNAPKAEPAVGLAGIPLFERLELEQRQKIVQSGFERRLDRGKVLFHETEPAAAMFALLDGRMKLVRYAPDGKELLLHLVQPGQTFAEAAAFGRARLSA